MILFVAMQWLETETVRLSHLRDRASDLGRKKEYPFLATHEALMHFICNWVFVKIYFCLCCLFLHVMLSVSLVLVMGIISSHVHMYHVKIFA